MKKIIGIGLIIVLIIGISVYFIIGNQKKINENSNDNATSQNENIDLNEEENNMEESEFASKINIFINGTSYTATLEDNETSREFIKRLPLEITMNELNGNEKYYYFDNSLPSNSTRISKINSGDLMLYGSDCLVLFYETFNTSYSYTKIGKIDNPTSLKSNVGNGSVKISFQK